VGYFTLVLAKFGAKSVGDSIFQNWSLFRKVRVINIVAPFSRHGVHRQTWSTEANKTSNESCSGILVDSCTVDNCPRLTSIP